MPTTKHILLILLIPVFAATAFLQMPGRMGTASLPAPLLIAPADGSVPSALRPAFEWEAVPGAAKYKLQISTSAAFTRTLLTSNPVASTFVPTRDLPANTILYWRVQALSSGGSSSWSAVWQFTSPNPPAKPVLSAPLNTNIPTYEPLLGWAAPENAPAYYQVQVATDSTFASLFLDAYTTAAHYQLPEGSLDHLVKYYWRVRAANDLDQFSGWSSTAWFRSPGQISGKIVASDTGLGLGGVSIQVQGKSLSGVTDSNGNYTIRGVMPGSHKLIPGADGYKFNKPSLTVKVSTVNPVERNFTAIPVLTVSGSVVLDPRANLVVGQGSAPVSRPWSLLNSGVPGVIVKDNQGHSASTDADGNYTITNALPGAYTLNLTKRGYTAIPLDRSFLLSDDALAQYFMVTPIMKPSTTLVFPTTTLLGRYSFSDNGRFLFIPNGAILDLYTGQQLPTGNWNFGDLSGSGRYASFSVAGLPVYNWGIFGMDRDTDNNGVFDEPGSVETWEVVMGHDWSKISIDGRYIVASSGPCGSISIQDIQTRAFICSPSLDTGFWPEISPNGRFILFLSWTNLVPADQNTGTADVYVYDRDLDENGIFDEDGGTFLDLVSVATDGHNTSNLGVKYNAQPMLSADGRWVVFQYWQLDSDFPDDTYRGFYLRDRLNRTTKKLRPNIQPVPGCEKLILDPNSPEITPDGRFILISGGLECKYSSTSSYLLGSPSYLLDRDPDQNGILDEQGFANFNQVDVLLSDEYAGCVGLSADGRFCIFGGGSPGSEMAPGIYLHDRGTTLSYNITGRVTDGNGDPVPGVTIDAGDGRMAFTDSEGFYFLAGLPGGAYYLQASGNEMTFSPSVRAVVVPPNSSGQDFKTTTGYVPLSSLGGRVADIYNNPLVGVTITDGSGGVTQTDNQGNYLFTDLPDGTYTLTPSSPGYEFHPQPITINVHGEEIGGLNYTGLQIFSITGRVEDQNGDGLAGVTVTDSYGNQAVTDLDGYYTLTGLPPGGYTLTPAKAGYTFNPAWMYIEVISGDVSAAAFTGVGP